MYELTIMMDPRRDDAQVENASFRTRTKSDGALLRTLGIKIYRALNKQYETNTDGYQRALEGGGPLPKLPGAP
jgi:hypothetical protein